MGRMINSSAYFASRGAVGKQFAQQFAALKFDGAVAVLAVSPGGAAIGMEIAKSQHALLGLLLLKHIYLPGEKKPLGVVNESGILTYGLDISKAFIEEFEMEYRAHIDHDRMEAVHEMHALGNEGILSPHYFSDKNVIIVSDFAKTGTAFKAAVDFLKPVKVRKIILATAVAQLEAIDVMHILGDKILIAHATDKNLPPEHYFEQDDVSHSSVIGLLKKQYTVKL